MFSHPKESRALSCVTTAWENKHPSLKTPLHSTLYPPLYILTSYWSLWCCRGCFDQEQDSAFGLLESPTIGLGPSIHPVQIPLQSLPYVQHINLPSSLVLSENLPRVHSIPLSRLLVQILNRRLQSPNSFFPLRWLLSFHIDIFPPDCWATYLAPSLCTHLSLQFYLSYLLQFNLVDCFRALPLKRKNLNLEWFPQTSEQRLGGCTIAELGWQQQQ